MIYIVVGIFIAATVILLILYLTRYRLYTDKLHAKDWKALLLGHTLHRTEFDFSVWKNKLSGVPQAATTRATIKPKNLPNSFAYNYSQLVPLQDQGECFTSSMFAALGMLANRQALNTKKPTMLSVQQYLDCKPWSCGEAQNIPDLLAYAQSVGLVTSQVYPYEMNTSATCMLSNDPPYYKRIHASNIVSLSPTTVIVGSEDHLYSIRQTQTAIHEDGPVCAVMEVYEDLLMQYRVTAFDTSSGSFTGAIYYPSLTQNRLLGYHAVQVIGWLKPNDDFEGAAWVCVSSWGHWPPAAWPSFPGMFFVRMGVNACGIESFLTAADPVEIEHG